MLAFTPSNGFLWAWTIFLLFLVVLVVPLVVILLGRLVAAGISLDKHARVADIAAKPVRANTEPIPKLGESLALIRDVVRVARVAEQHGAELEKVLKRDLVRR